MKSATKLKIPTHKKCWATDCGHRQDTHNCVFSAFPRNPERCKQWLRVVGIKDFVGLPINKLSTIRFICSCHFQIDDYKLIKNGKRLHENAIPSIFSENTIPLTEADLKEFLPNALSVIPTCSLRVPVEKIIKSNQFSFHNMFNRLKTEESIESAKSKCDITREKHQVVLMDAIGNQRSAQDELLITHKNKVLSLESITEEKSIALTPTPTVGLGPISKASSLLNFCNKYSNVRKRRYSTTDIEAIDSSLISSPSSGPKKRNVRSSGNVIFYSKSKYDCCMGPTEKLIAFQENIPSGDMINCSNDIREMYSFFYGKLKECITKTQGSVAREVFLKLNNIIDLYI